MENKYILLTLPALLLVGLISVAYAQSDIKGDVVNSKYLTITDHKYTQEQFSDTITGTIQNNSPQDVNFARVYAALYDNTNALITVESGIVSISQLKAGDSSPFDIHIFSNVKSDIDHYTLFAAGTPL